MRLINSKNNFLYCGLCISATLGALAVLEGFLVVFFPSKGIVKNLSKKIKNLKTKQ